MGIARGAERIGLASRAVKASKTHLDELPLPAVVHWEGNHWVVLYAVEDGHVRLADPARGRVRVAREEFDEKWTRLRGAARVHARARGAAGRAHRLPLARAASSARTGAASRSPSRSRSSPPGSSS